MNDDGLISKSEYVEHDNDYSNVRDYIYTNGNLTKMISVYEMSGSVSTNTYNYAYDSKKAPFYYCKTPKWLLQLSFFEYDEGGILFKNNIETIIGSSEYGTTTITFDLEYDTDNFVTKQTLKAVYEDGEYSQMWEFTYITK